MRREEREEKMEQEKFKKMVMELHSYSDSDITTLSRELKQALIKNTLDTLLKNNCAMSNNEISEFKEKYNI